MSPTYDVVVIGAGIIGAACAAECVREKLKVAIVEPDMVGGGATASGMGHIVVMDDSEAQFALTRYSQILWQELVHDVPAEVEYIPCGTIWVAADEEEMQEVQRKRRFYQDREVRVEVLSGEELGKVEPNLRPGLAGGLLVPDDAVLYAPAAAAFLIERATKGGSTLYLGDSVTSIREDGVTLSNNSFLSSGITINATGASAAKLTAGLSIHPRKGHLVITDRYPSFVQHQLVELGYLKSAHSSSDDSVAFNIQPRLTGQVLVGSSRQYGMEGPEIEGQVLARMLRQAVGYMPGLKQLSAIRSWTGFRAATPDKLPFIGPCPASASDSGSGPGPNPSSGRKSRWLATGHEGLGITTSLGTAKLLVDELMNRESLIPRGPYSPSRAGAFYA